MKNGTVGFYGDGGEARSDEYEDDSGFALTVPKRSSIRRRERFRTREFVPDPGRRSRRKHRRQSIRTDSKFWEV